MNRRRRGRSQRATRHAGVKAASKRRNHINGDASGWKIADWDAIWVSMQDGAIVEQGSYAELSAANGAFATLLAHRQEDIFKCTRFTPLSDAL